MVSVVVDDRALPSSIPPLKNELLRNLTALVSEVADLVEVDDLVEGDDVVEVVVSCAVTGRGKTTAATPKVTTVRKIRCCLLPLFTPLPVIVLNNVAGSCRFGCA